MIMIELITATQLDYFDNIYIEAKEDKVERDDFIITETKRGIEMLRVVKPNYHVPKDNIVEPDGRFVRRATEEDVETFHNNQSLAQEALGFCKEAVVKEGLDMQLVNAKYTLDRKKLIFNFTADERVDFRNLVRVLATRFKTRHRAASDRGTGRSKISWRHRTMWTRTLLFDIPWGFRSGEYPDGQKSGSFFESYKDIRGLRPSHVLSEL